MHTLRILIVPTNKTISLKLDLDTVVYDICRDLFKRIPPKENLLVEEFGIFVPDADSMRAYWLDNSKPVSYYPLGDKNLVLLFKSRNRRLIIRTMDETKKTLEVDDSKSIAELILPICNKMGISNHEEYSLIYELDETERMKTMTIKRGKTQLRDFDKLEKMKQKLKTDDELNWLPHGKTLRQLGIDEKDELLLRRKYFFSDQNVDARDPIQLNLLYVQLRNAIIDGTHPVNIEEAIQLAGIQCQVEFGNLAPDKAKSIHSNLKEFLPKEYVKTKGIDKKIISQYEKLSGKADKDVKVMYAQLCRSLKTYGITFFLVKEKVRAKNKLVPRLMGISKENVMRVDEKTKEMIQSWPLTTVRRYAATASLFSLDFGDYSDENYVIQTTEGEKIAQLIGGYIDIIIKKQKAKDNLSAEAEEETAMIEENVAPSKANVISHNLIDKNPMSFERNAIATIGQIPTRGDIGIVSQGRVGSAHPIAIRNDSKIGQGHVNAQPQKFQIRDLSQPKRALMIRIGDNLKILKAATEDLDKQIEVAKLGNDESSRNYRKQTLDIAKTRVKGNLMSMTMATGNLLMMMQHDDDSDDNDDYGRIDAAIATIGYNTDKLLENIRHVYEMTFEADDEDISGGNLIEAAKTLLNAFQDLLNASKPINIESDASLSDESINVEKPVFSDKALMEAVNRVGEASRLLLHIISVEQNSISDMEWQTRDTLLTDAKQIANLVSGMVKIVKEASVALKETQGAEAQALLIHAAKNSGQATSRLISAAKVVACSIEQPLSQQQLHASAQQVIDSVDNVMQLVQPLIETHSTIYQQLDESVVMVCESIDKLKQHLIINSITAHQDPLVTKFLSASERLPAAIGNSSEMVTQAQILAQAGTELADCLNSAALVQSPHNNISQSTSSLDSDRQRRLMIAAQALTDAVGKLVHATKICVKESEQTIENQQCLMQAAHHMTSVAHMTAGEIIRQRLSKGLEFAGRQTALTADQLVLSSQEAAKTTRASNYQICSEAQEMTEIVLPEVILACTKIRENPIDSNAQNNLLNACQKLIQNLEQLLKSSEALEPRVKDPSIQSALNISMQNSQTSLADLKQCVQQADTVFKPTRVANIANIEDGQLQTLHSWMDTAAESVARGELYPLPGETIESVSAIIGSSSKAASKIFDKLYNNLPDLNNYLSDNSPENVGLQSDFIRSAKELMESMEKLLRGARGIAALKSKTDSSENLYEKQIDVIDCGKQIIRSGEDVIQGIKLASIRAVGIDELKKSIDKMKEDIDELVYRIPAYQEIDSLVAKLKSSMQLFDENVINKPAVENVNKTKSHSQVQSEFTTAVAIFNQTLGDLINSNLTHSALTLLAKQLNESHDCMLMTGLQLIGEVLNNKQQLASGLKSVSNNSTDLLDHLKLLLAASGSSDVNLLKQSLLKAASNRDSMCRVFEESSQILIKYFELSTTIMPYLENVFPSLEHIPNLCLVSDSINDLLSACASTLPVTQQLCESSQRQLEALKTSLLAEPPSLPINNCSYNQCMQSVEELSESLLTQMKRIPVACKTGDTNDFCSAVQTLSASTVDMMKVVTQANYKLGLIQSNPSIGSASTITNPILDSLVQHASVISKNCISMASSHNSEIPCRELATDIKSRASSVCQLVKECINSSSDPDHQNKLLEAGKRVAEATANLIKTINSSPRSESGEIDEWTSACEVVLNTVEQISQIAKYTPITNPVVETITEQGRQAQAEIHEASIEMVEGSCSLLRAAGALVKDSKSIPANQAFIINQKTYDSCLNRLRNVVKFSAPGQREFMEMEEELKQVLRNLDRANMEQFSASKSSKMNAKSSDSINSDIQRMQLSLKQLKNNIPLIENVLSDQSRFEYLGRAVWQAGSYLAPIAESSNNLAQLLPHSRDRGEVIELTKTVLEAFLAMVQECETLSTTTNNQELMEYVSSLKVGCDDLMKFIDGIASCHGTLENMIASIQKSAARLTEHNNVAPSDAASAHTLIFQSIKGITDAVNDNSLNKDIPVSRLQKKESMKRIKADEDNQILSQNKMGDLNYSFKKLVHDYDSLVTGVVQIMSSGAFSVQEGEDKLKKCVVAVGQSCMDLIRYDQNEFIGQVRSRLTDLMYLLQSSSRGTQCCIVAANSVNEMVADLDTAILFAGSGTLALSLINSENDQNKPNSVAQIKEDIFKITKSMVSDLQKMVVSVDGKQENLAMATDNTVRRASQLCGAVKSSALAIGSNPSLLGLSEMSDECISAQTLLLNAVRDVAVALVDFFNCTKMNVAATTDKERDRSNLKISLETMVKSIDGLIKSVKSLEDSGCRGTRALETSLEAMRKEYRTLENWIPDEEDVFNSKTQEGEYSQINGGIDNVTASSDKIYSVENLVLMTKPLILASQKAMIAVQTFKQEDILMAANIGRKAITDLVHHIRITIEKKLKEENSKPSRIFSEKAPIVSDPDRRTAESVKDNSMKIVEHGKGAVKALIDMYENLNKSVAEGKKNESHKMQMTLASRRIAHSIHEITESATHLKDTQLVDRDDMNSHCVIAENELLEAASQIETAAKKIALLKPRKSMKKDTGEEYTFDGQIIVACGSIVSATSHLVKMAALSQQELVSQGRLKPSENVSDQNETQWSHGLISAARLVAAATENLSDSAKAVVQGKCGTDRLISASKQVAAGTAHLLLACQVKSDADSKTNQRLQAAGSAVKRATEALVKEATEHRDVQDGTIPYTYDGPNKSMVNSMRNVIQAQADIVAKERELEMLRNKYQTIRQGHISTHPELFADKD